MVVDESVRPSTLMSMSAMLHSSEDTSTRREPTSKVRNPGRKITSAPKKPAKIAVQRRQRNTSPRNSALSSAVNSGAVNESAVARQRRHRQADEEGEHRHDVEHGADDVQCKPLGVEEAPPMAHQQRRMTTSPNTLRKNATSTGGSCWVE